MFEDSWSDTSSTMDTSSGSGSGSNGGDEHLYNSTDDETTELGSMFSDYSDASTYSPNLGNNRSSLFSAGENASVESVSDYDYDVESNGNLYLSHEGFVAPADEVLPRTRVGNNVAEGDTDFSSDSSEHEGATGGARTVPSPTPTVSTSRRRRGGRHRASRSSPASRRQHGVGPSQNGTRRGLVVGATAVEYRHPQTQNDELFARPKRADDLPDSWQTPSECTMFLSIKDLVTYETSELLTRAWPLVPSSVKCASFPPYTPFPTVPHILDERYPNTDEIALFMRECAQVIPQRYTSPTPLYMRALLVRAYAAAEVHRVRQAAVHQYATSETVLLPYWEGDSRSDSDDDSADDDDDDDAERRGLAGEKRNGGKWKRSQTTAGGIPVSPHTTVPMSDIHSVSSFDWIVAMMSTTWSPQVPLGVLKDLHKVVDRCGFGSSSEILHSWGMDVFFRRLFRQVQAATLTSHSRKSWLAVAGSLLCKLALAAQNVNRVLSVVRWIAIHTQQLKDIPFKGLQPWVTSIAAQRVSRLRLEVPMLWRNTQSISLAQIAHDLPEGSQFSVSAIGAYYDELHQVDVLVVFSSLGIYKFVAKPFAILAVNKEVILAGCVGVIVNNDTIAVQVNKGGEVGGSHGSNGSIFHFDKNTLQLVRAVAVVPPSTPTLTSPHSPASGEFGDSPDASNGRRPVGQTPLREASSTRFEDSDPVPAPARITPIFMPNGNTVSPFFQNDERTPYHVCFDSSTNVRGTVEPAVVFIPRRCDSLSVQFSVYATPPRTSTSIQLIHLQTGNKTWLSVEMKLNSTLSTMQIRFTHGDNIVAVVEEPIRSEWQTWSAILTSNGGAASWVVYKDGLICETVNVSGSPVRVVQSATVELLSGTFSGFVAELQVWHRALPISELRTSSTDTSSTSSSSQAAHSSLLVSFLMDEGSGCTLQGHGGVWWKAVSPAFRWVVPPMPLVDYAVPATPSLISYTPSSPFYVASNGFEAVIMEPTMLTWINNDGKVLEQETHPAQLCDPCFYSSASGRFFAVSPDSTSVRWVRTSSRPTSSLMSLPSLNVSPSFSSLPLPSSSTSASKSNQRPTGDGEIDVGGKGQSTKVPPPSSASLSTSHSIRKNSRRSTTTSTSASCLDFGIVVADKLNRVMLWATHAEKGNSGVQADTKSSLWNHTRDISLTTVSRLLVLCEECIEALSTNACSHLSFTALLLCASGRMLAYQLTVMERRCPPEVVPRVSALLESLQHLGDGQSPLIGEARDVLSNVHRTVLVKCVSHDDQLQLIVESSNLSDLGDILTPDHLTLLVANVIKTEVQKPFMTFLRRLKEHCLAESLAVLSSETTSALSPNPGSPVVRDRTESGEEGGAEKVSGNATRFEANTAMLATLLALLAQDENPKWHLVAVAMIHSLCRGVIKQMGKCRAHLRSTSAAAAATGAGAGTGTGTGAGDEASRTSEHNVELDDVFLEKLKRTAIGIVVFPLTHMLIDLKTEGRTGVDILMLLNDTRRDLSSINLPQPQPPAAPGPTAGAAARTTPVSPTSRQGDAGSTKNSGSGGGGGEREDGFESHTFTEVMTVRIPPVLHTPYHTTLKLPYASMLEVETIPDGTLEDEIPVVTTSLISSDLKRTVQNMLTGATGAVSHITGGGTLCLTVGPRPHAKGVSITVTAKIVLQTETSRWVRDTKMALCHAIVRQTHNMLLSDLPRGMVISQDSFLRGGLRSTALLSKEHEKKSTPTEALLDGVDHTQLLILCKNEEPPDSARDGENADGSTAHRRQHDDPKAIIEAWQSIYNERKLPYHDKVEPIVRHCACALAWHAKPVREWVLVDYLRDAVAQLRKRWMLIVESSQQGRTEETLARCRFLLADLNPALRMEAIIAENQSTEEAATEAPPSLSSGGTSSLSGRAMPRNVSGHATASFGQRGLSRSVAMLPRVATESRHDLFQLYNNGLPSSSGGKPRYLSWQQQQHQHILKKNGAWNAFAADSDATEQLKHTVTRQVFDFIISGLGAHNMEDIKKSLTSKAVQASRHAAAYALQEELCKAASDDIGIIRSIISLHLEYRAMLQRHENSGNAATPTPATATAATTATTATTSTANAIPNAATGAMSTVAPAAQHASATTTGAGASVAPQERVRGGTAAAAAGAASADQADDADEGERALNNDGTSRVGAEGGKEESKDAHYLERLVGCGLEREYELQQAACSFFHKVLLSVMQHPSEGQLPHDTEVLLLCALLCHPWDATDMSIMKPEKIFAFLQNYVDAHVDSVKRKELIVPQLQHQLPSRGRRDGAPGSPSPASPVLGVPEDEASQGQRDVGKSTLAEIGLLNLDTRYMISSNALSLMNSEGIQSVEDEYGTGVQVEGVDVYVTALQAWKTTSSPTKLAPEIHYFEVTLGLILTNKPIISVGVSSSTMALTDQPSKESVIAFQSDGHVYVRGQECSFTNGWNVGDVVGCGLLTATNDVFFTHNGEFLGVAARCNSPNIMPFFSVQAKQSLVKVQVSFGDKHPFRFNFTTLHSTCQQRIISPKMLSDGAFIVLHYLVIMCHKNMRKVESNELASTVKDSVCIQLENAAIFLRHVIVSLVRKLRSDVVDMEDDMTQLLTTLFHTVDIVCDCFRFDSVTPRTHTEILRLCAVTLVDSKSKAVQVRAARCISGATSALRVDYLADAMAELEKQVPTSTIVQQLIGLARKRIAKEVRPSPQYTPLWTDNKQVVNGKGAYFGSMPVPTTGTTTVGFRISRRQQQGCGSALGGCYYVGYIVGQPRIRDMTALLSRDDAFILQDTDDQDQVPHLLLRRNHIPRNYHRRVYGNEETVWVTYNASQGEITFYRNNMELIGLAFNEVPRVDNLYPMVYLYNDDAQCEIKALQQSREMPPEVWVDGVYQSEAIATLQRLHISPPFSEAVSDYITRAVAMKDEGLDDCLIALAVLGGQRSYMYCQHDSLGTVIVDHVEPDGKKAIVYLDSDRDRHLFPVSTEALNPSFVKPPLLLYPDFQTEATRCARLLARELVAITNEGTYMEPLVIEERNRRDEIEKECYQDRAALNADLIGLLRARQQHGTRNLTGSMAPDGATPPRQQLSGSRVRGAGGADEQAGEVPATPPSRLQSAPRASDAQTMEDAASPPMDMEDSVTSTSTGVQNTSLRAPDEIDFVPPFANEALTLHPITIDRQFSSRTIHSPTPFVAVTGAGNQTATIQGTVLSDQRVSFAVFLETVLDGDAPKDRMYVGVSSTKLGSKFPKTVKDVKSSLHIWALCDQDVAEFNSNKCAVEPGIISGVDHQLFTSGDIVVTEIDRNERTISFSRLRKGKRVEFGVIFDGLGEDLELRPFVFCGRESAVVFSFSNSTRFPSRGTFPSSTVTTSKWKGTLCSCCDCPLASTSVVYRSDAGENLCEQCFCTWQRPQSRFFVCGVQPPIPPYLMSSRSPKALHTGDYVEFDEVPATNFALDKCVNVAVTGTEGIVTSEEGFVATESLTLIGDARVDVALSHISGVEGHCFGGVMPFSPLWSSSQPAAHETTIVSACMAVSTTRIPVDCKCLFILHLKDLRGFKTYKMSNAFIGVTTLEEGHRSLSRLDFERLADRTLWGAWAEMKAQGKTSSTIYVLVDTVNGSLVLGSSLIGLQQNPSHITSSLPISGEQNLRVMVYASETCTVTSLQGYISLESCPHNGVNSLNPVGVGLIPDDAIAPSAHKPTSSAVMLYNTPSRTQRRSPGWEISPSFRSHSVYFVIGDIITVVKEGRLLRMYRNGQLLATMELEGAMWEGRTRVLVHLCGCGMTVSLVPPLFGKSRLGRIIQTFGDDVGIVEDVVGHRHPHQKRRRHQKFIVSRKAVRLCTVAAAIENLDSDVVPGAVVAYQEPGAVAPKRGTVVRVVEGMVTVSGPRSDSGSSTTLDVTRLYPLSNEDVEVVQRAPYPLIGRPSGAETHAFAVGRSRYSFVKRASYNGVMFDCIARQSIDLTGISLISRTAGYHRVEAFYRLGTHRGHERKPNSWTRIFSKLMELQNESHYTLEFHGIPVEASQTIALYINTSHNCAVCYYSADDGCTGDVGTAIDSDESLVVLMGRLSDISTPFTESEGSVCGFCGTLFYKQRQGIRLPLIESDSLGNLSDVGGITLGDPVALSCRPTEVVPRKQMEFTIDAYSNSFVISKLVLPVVSGIPIDADSAVQLYSEDARSADGGSRSASYLAMSIDNRMAQWETDLPANFTVTVFYRQIMGVAPRSPEEITAEEDKRSKGQRRKSTRSWKQESPFSCPEDDGEDDGDAAWQWLWMSTQSFTPPITKVTVAGRPIRLNPGRYVFRATILEDTHLPHGARDPTYVSSFSSASFVSSLYANDYDPSLRECGGASGSCERGGVVFGQSCTTNIKGNALMSVTNCTGDVYLHVDSRSCASARGNLQQLVSGLSLNQNSTASYNGIMFNMQSKRDIIIDEIFCVPQTTADHVMVRVFWKEGGLEGSERNSNDWVEVATADRSIVDKVPFSVGSLNLNMVAKQTYAVYINTSSSSGVRFYNGSEGRIGSAGEEFDSDGVLTVYVGRKSESSTPFSDIPVDSRAFRGRVTYRILSFPALIVEKKEAQFSFFRGYIASRLLAAIFSFLDSPMGLQLASQRADRAVYLSDILNLLQCVQSLSSALDVSASKQVAYNLEASLTADLAVTCIEDLRDIAVRFVLANDTASNFRALSNGDCVVTVAGHTLVHGTTSEQQLQKQAKQRPQLYELVGIMGDHGEKAILEPLGTPQVVPSPTLSSTAVKGRSTATAGKSGNQSQKESKTTELLGVGSSKDSEKRIAVPTNTVLPVSQCHLCHLPMTQSSRCRVTMSTHRQPADAKSRNLAIIANHLHHALQYDSQVAVRIAHNIVYNSMSHIPMPSTGSTTSTKPPEHEQHSNQTTATSTATEAPEQPAKRLPFAGGLASNSISVAEYEMRMKPRSYCFVPHASLTEAPGNLHDPHASISPSSSSAASRHLSGSQATSEVLDSTTVLFHVPAATLTMIREGNDDEPEVICPFAWCDILKSCVTLKMTVKSNSCLGVTFVADLDGAQAEPNQDETPVGRGGRHEVYTLALDIRYLRSDHKDDAGELEESEQRYCCPLSHDALFFADSRGSKAVPLPTTITQLHCACLQNNGIVTFRLVVTPAHLPPTTSSVPTVIPWVWTNKCDAICVAPGELATIEGNIDPSKWPVAKSHICPLVMSTVSDHGVFLELHVLSTVKTSSHPNNRIVRRFSAVCDEQLDVVVTVEGDVAVHDHKDAVLCCIPAETIRKEGLTLASCSVGIMNSWKDKVELTLRQSAKPLSSDFRCSKDVAQAPLHSAFPTEGSYYMPQWVSYDTSKVVLSHDKQTASCDKNRSGQAVLGTPLPTTEDCAFVLQISRSDRESGESLGSGHFAGIALSTFDDFSIHFQKVRSMEKALWVIQDVLDDDSLGTQEKIPPLNKKDNFMYYAGTKLVFFLDHKAHTLSLARNDEQPRVVFRNIPEGVSLSPFARLDNQTTSATISAYSFRHQGPSPRPLTVIKDVVSGELFTHSSIRHLPFPVALVSFPVLRHFIRSLPPTHQQIVREKWLITTAHSRFEYNLNEAMAALFNHGAFSRSMRRCSDATAEDYIIAHTSLCAALVEQLVHSFSEQYVVVNPSDYVSLQTVQTHHHADPSDARNTRKSKDTRVVFQLPSNYEILGVCSSDPVMVRLLEFNEVRPPLETTLHIFPLDLERVQVSLTNDVVRNPCVINQRQILEPVNEIRDIVGVVTDGWFDTTLEHLLKSTESAVKETGTSAADQQQRKERGRKEAGAPTALTLQMEEWITPSVMCAVEHWHLHGLAHGHIHPRNIYVELAGGRNDAMCTALWNVHVLPYTSPFAGPELARTGVRTCNGDAWSCGKVLSCLSQILSKNTYLRSVVTGLLESTASASNGSQSLTKAIALSQVLLDEQYREQSKPRRRMELGSGLRGGTGSYNGIMFDVIAKVSAVHITQITFVSDITASTVVRLYYRQGSFKGSESSKDMWRRATEKTISLTEGVSVALDGFVPIEILAGQRVALFLHTTSSNGVRFFSETDGVTADMAEVQEENTDISVTVGKKCESDIPFTSVQLQRRYPKGSLAYYLVRPKDSRRSSLQPLSDSVMDQEQVKQYDSLGKPVVVKSRMALVTRTKPVVATAAAVVAPEERGEPPLQDDVTPPSQSLKGYIVIDEKRTILVQHEDGRRLWYPSEAIVKESDFSLTSLPATTLPWPPRFIKDLIGQQNPFDFAHCALRRTSLTVDEGQQPIAQQTSPSVGSSYVTTQLRLTKKVDEDDHKHSHHRKNLLKGNETPASVSPMLMSPAILVSTVDASESRMPGGLLVEEGTPLTLSTHELGSVPSLELPAPLVELHNHRSIRSSYVSDLISRACLIVLQVAHQHHSVSCAVSVSGSDLPEKTFSNLMYIMFDNVRRLVVGYEYTGARTVLARLSEDLEVTPQRLYVRVCDIEARSGAADDCSVTELHTRPMCALHAFVICETTSAMVRQISPTSVFLTLPPAATMHPSAQTPFSVAIGETVLSARHITQNHRPALLLRSNAHGTWARDVRISVLPSHGAAPECSSHERHAPAQESSSTRASGKGDGADDIQNTRQFTLRVRYAESTSTEKEDAAILHLHKHRSTCCLVEVIRDSYTELATPEHPASFSTTSQHLQISGNTVTQVLPSSIPSNAVVTPVLNEHDHHEIDLELVCLPWRPIKLKVQAPVGKKHQEIPIPFVPSRSLEVGCQNMRVTRVHLSVNMENHTIAVSTDGLPAVVHELRDSNSSTLQLVFSLATTASSVRIVSWALLAESSSSQETALWQRVNEMLEGSAAYPSPHVTPEPGIITRHTAPSKMAETRGLSSRDAGMAGGERSSGGASSPRGSGGTAGGGGGGGSSDGVAGSLADPNSRSSFTSAIGTHLEELIVFYSRAVLEKILGMHSVIARVPTTTYLHMLRHSRFQHSVELQMAIVGEIRRGNVSLVAEACTALALPLSEQHPLDVHNSLVVLLTALRDEACRYIIQSPFGESLFLLTLRVATTYTRSTRHTALEVLLEILKTDSCPLVPHGILTTAISPILSMMYGLCRRNKFASAVVQFGVSIASELFRRYHVERAGLTAPTTNSILPFHVVTCTRSIVQAIYSNPPTPLPRMVQLIAKPHYITVSKTVEQPLPTGGTPVSYAFKQPFTCTFGVRAFQLDLHPGRKGSIFCGWEIEITEHQPPTSLGASTTATASYAHSPSASDTLRPSGSVTGDMLGEGTSALGVISSITKPGAVHAWVSAKIAQYPYCFCIERDGRLFEYRNGAKTMHMTLPTDVPSTVVIKCSYHDRSVSFEAFVEDKPLTVREIVLPKQSVIGVPLLELENESDATVHFGVTDVLSASDASSVEEARWSNLPAGYTEYLHNPTALDTAVPPQTYDFYAELTAFSDTVLTTQQQSLLRRFGGSMLGCCGSSNAVDETLKVGADEASAQLAEAAAAQNDAPPQLNLLSIATHNVATFPLISAFLNVSPMSTTVDVTPLAPYVQRLNGLDSLFGAFSNLVDLRRNTELLELWRRVKALCSSTARQRIQTLALQPFVGRSGTKEDIVIHPMQAQPSIRHGAVTTLMWSYFGQIYQQLQPRLVTTYYTSPMFTVKLAGFGSLDVGGPYRDVLSQLACEIMTTHPSGKFQMNPLFALYENSETAAVMPNMKFMQNSQAPLMLEFFGRLLASFFVTTDILPVSLPQIFWKLLQSDEVTVRDLLPLDPSIISRVSEDILLDSETEELEERFPGFTETWVTYCENEGIALPKDGVQKCPVSSPATAKELSSFLIDYEIHRYDEAIACIQRGFNEVVPLYTLQAFRWQDVEHRITGERTLSAEALKKECIMQLPRQDADMFWQVVSSMSDEDRMLLLRFSTGQSRLPIRKPIKIQRLPIVQDALPTSSTCFFVLKIPSYSSIRVMEERILYAIRQCNAIDTDTQAAGQILLQF